MKEIQNLLREVKRYYKKEGRAHLPWRKTKDPYKILVSEVMLQQTQVERVIPFYNAWMKKFPTAKKLAAAKLPDVLRAWQGLGYNRRAKFLHEAAKVLAGAEFPKKGVGVPFISPFLGNSGRLPVEFLESLPGVGPYTARAVSVFAFNKPEVFIETNIRTVFIHSNILQNKKMISDTELLPLVAEALKKSKMQPRDFYAALMDYGSYLKKTGVRNNSRSKHYAKQSKFEGSARQLRGAILRELLASPKTLPVLIKNLSRKKGEVERELQRLEAEGLLTRQGRSYSL